VCSYGNRYQRGSFSLINVGERCFTACVVFLSLSVCNCVQVLVWLSVCGGAIAGMQTCVSDMLVGCVFMGVEYKRERLFVLVMLFA